MDSGRDVSAISLASRGKSLPTAYDVRERGRAREREVEHAMVHGTVVPVCALSPAITSSLTTTTSSSMVQGYVGAVASCRSLNAGAPEAARNPTIPAAALLNARTFAHADPSTRLRSALCIQGQCMHTVRTYPAADSHR